MWRTPSFADSAADVRVPRVYAAFLRNTVTPDCDIGHIIMEYIDAPDCGGEGDDQLVAKAVQKLISVKGPNAAPGPVGGGPVQ